MLAPCPTPIKLSAPMRSSSSPLLSSTSLAPAPCRRYPSRSRNPSLRSLLSVPDTSPSPSLASRGDTSLSSKSMSLALASSALSSFSPPRSARSDHLSCGGDDLSSLPPASASRAETDGLDGMPTLVDHSDSSELDDEYSFSPASSPPSSPFATPTARLSPSPSALPESQRAFHFGSQPKHTRVRAGPSNHVDDAAVLHCPAPECVFTATVKTRAVLARHLRTDHADFSVPDHKITRLGIASCLHCGQAWTCRGMKKHLNSCSSSGALLPPALRPSERESATDFTFLLFCGALLSADEEYVPSDSVRNRLAACRTRWLDFQNWCISFASHLSLSSSPARAAILRNLAPAGLESLSPQPEYLLAMLNSFASAQPVYFRDICAAIESGSSLSQHPNPRSPGSHSPQHCPATVSQRSASSQCPDPPPSPQHRPASGSASPHSTSPQPDLSRPCSSDIPLPETLASHPRLYSYLPHSAHTKWCAVARPAFAEYLTASRSGDPHALDLAMSRLLFLPQRALVKKRGGTKGRYRRQLDRALEGALRQISATGSESLVPPSSPSRPSDVKAACPSAAPATSSECLEIPPVSSSSPAVPSQHSRPCVQDDPALSFSPLAAATLPLVGYDRSKSFAALQLVKAGHLSKASARLTSLGSLPRSASTADALQELHPPNGRHMPPPPATSHVLVVDDKHLSEALDKCANGSGPGASG